jgi:phage terminase small subunit
MANPKSTEALKATGNYRENRHGKRDEIEQTFDGQPSLPPFVKLTPEERKVWRYVLKVLPPNILKATDSLALANLCKLWVQYSTIQTRASDTGEYKEVMKQATVYKHLERAMDKVGLSPTARAKIASTLASNVQEEVDPLDEF